NPFRPGTRSRLKSSACANVPEKPELARCACVPFFRRAAACQCRPADARSRDGASLLRSQWRGTEPAPGRASNMRFLAAIAALILSCGLAAAERRVALVIGIDRYESLRPLGNAVNDARAI